MILKSLKKWRDGKVQPPVVMDLNLTDYCNLKCLSCWQRNWKYKRLDSKHYQLSDERLLSLIDEAALLGIKKIMITGGGEPLMRSVTKKLMLKIKEKKIIGEITTNGTLFTESFIKDLVSVGWDKIVFSIDGPDAETNDYLRGKGSFDLAHKTLMEFVRIKKQKNKKLPLIAINTVLSKKNVDNLDKMILLAKETGVKIVSFEPLTVHSWNGKKLKLNDVQIMKMQKNVPEIEKLAEKLRIATNISNLQKPDYIKKSNDMKNVIVTKKSAINIPKYQEKYEFSQASCFEPWYHIVVKVDGACGPCCIFEEKTLNVKTMSLEEIWYGPWFEKMRQNMIKENLPAWCKICNTGQVVQNQELRKKLRS